MPRNTRLSLSTLIVLTLASGIGAGISVAAGADKPARLEEHPGSDLKRVILTRKAAERLAIQTAPVREEPVMRWLSLAAEVEMMAQESTAMAAADSGSPTGAITTTDAAPLRVDVPLPENANQMIGQAVPMLSLASRDDDDDDDDGDDDKQDSAKAADDDDNDTPAVVFVMPTGGGQGAKRLRAKLIEVAPNADLSGVPHAYYMVDLDKTSGLRPGQRVNVRVPQSGSGKPQKVIPHSAVIYDAQGATWTYTNPEPLVFTRHRVNVEYIQDDLAVLTDGPAVGTAVVTRGAAELHGIEQKFGH